MNRIILHFDMNSYFASVEQQANPFLRGKPVGVLATMTPHGCVLASSREAKAYGIKTGCRADEARQLCPDVVLLEVDPPKYRSTTQAIFSLCAEYTEDIEPYSIDEAFMNLTGVAATNEEAARIGMEIRRRIKEEVGEWLQCSMGIAWTRWLAKFGGDTAPKGGMVILTRENLYNYLVGRDVKEAWGIAGALSARLHMLGITTLDELARYPVQNLMTALGKQGYYLWANVNGIELSGVERKQSPKSIGHSHVLRQRSNDVCFHQAVVSRLAERTGRRLREQGLEGHGLYYYVRFHERDALSASCKVHRPITSTGQIFRAVWEAVGPAVRQSTPAMFALGLFGLRPRTDQMEFFVDKKISPELSRALDEINDRYGEETIVRGPLLNLNRIHAPDRVGFRKTMAAEFRGAGEYGINEE